MIMKNVIPCSKVGIYILFIRTNRAKDYFL